MNIFKAYLNGWKNWKRFDGRTRRRDYWGFMICNWLVIILLYIFIAVGSFFDIGGLFIVLTFIYVLLAIVPTIAITIRRLHDTNHSALYYLVSFVPVIGNLWFFILMCTEGTYGKNDFGLDPKEVLLDNNTSVDYGDYPDFRS